MRPIALIVFVLSVGFVCGQVQTTTDPSKDPVYFCPMDRDIRSNTPGNCSRCGMKLVAAVPDPIEDHLDFVVIPHILKPGENVHVKFVVHDPWKNNRVKELNNLYENFVLVVI